MNQQKEEINEYFCRIGRLQAILLMFVFFVFLIIGKKFVTIFAGQDYINSYYVSIILMGTTIIPLSQNLGIDVQKAMNKHQFRSVLYMAVAVFNILISIPLCKKFGAVGCALGTGLGQIIGNTVCMNIYYYRKIGINVFAFYKEILNLLPVFGITCLVCLLLDNIFHLQGLFINNFAANSVPTIIKLLGFICLGGIVSIVFFAGLWIGGFNKYEKELLKGFFRKIHRI